MRVLNEKLITNNVYVTMKLIVHCFGFIFYLDGDTMSHICMRNNNTIVLDVLIK